MALLRGKGVEVEGLLFDGGHEWAAELLSRAGGFLAGHLSQP